MKLQHNFDKHIARSSLSTGCSGYDEKLIDRLIASYQGRSTIPTGMWAHIYDDLHREIDEVFSQNDRLRIEEILRNPITSDLLYGFDNTTKTLREKWVQPQYDLVGFDALITLAEAVGARRMINPESQPDLLVKDDIDSLLGEIETALGVKLSFPNFYPQEYGLISTKGVIHKRAIYAIYQAWRTAQVLEGI